MGAQLLLSPSAWAVDADHDNQIEPYGQLWRTAYAELGRLYDLPVVGVSSVGWLSSGPWKGRKLIGCSLATDNRGEIVAQGPYGESAEALIRGRRCAASAEGPWNANRRRSSIARLFWAVTHGENHVWLFATGRTPRMWPSGRWRSSETGSAVSYVPTLPASSRISMRR